MNQEVQLLIDTFSSIVEIQESHSLLEDELSHLNKLIDEVKQRHLLKVNISPKIRSSVQFQKRVLSNIKTSLDKAQDDSDDSDIEDLRVIVDGLEDMNEDASDSIIELLLNFESLLARLSSPIENLLEDAHDDGTGTQATELYEPTKSSMVKYDTVATKLRLQHDQFVLDGLKTDYSSYYENNESAVSVTTYNLKGCDSKKLSDMAPTLCNILLEQKSCITFLCEIKPGCSFDPLSAQMGRSFRTLSFEKVGRAFGYSECFHFIYDSNILTPVERGELWRWDSARNFCSILFKAKNSHLLFLGCHLGSKEEKRQKELHAIPGLIQAILLRYEKRFPSVERLIPFIVGDFNTLPSFPGFANSTRQSTMLESENCNDNICYPSADNRIVLEEVFVPTSITPALQRSDHLPVSARFTISKPP